MSTLASSSEAAATTSAPTTTNVSSDRLSALLGIIGSLIIGAGFFLPWQLQSQADTHGGASVVPVSGWDIASNYAFGRIYVLPSATQVHTQVSVPYALLVATPLLMAIVLLVLSILVLFRRLGPLAWGLWASGALLGFFTAFNVLPTFFLTITLGVALNSNKPFVGIGLDLLYLGYFIVIAVGIGGALRSMKAS